MTDEEYRQGRRNKKVKPELSKSLDDDLERQLSGKPFRILAVLPINTQQVDQKTRLFGMIKAERKIDLIRASKCIEMNVDEIRGAIYNLVGEGTVQGEFLGNTCIIKSDIEDFIASLDKEFSTCGSEGRAHQN